MGETERNSFEPRPDNEKMKCFQEIVGAAHRCSAERDSKPHHDVPG